MYGSANGVLYVSEDGGLTFNQTAILGSSQSTNGMATNNIGKAGELWITTEKGVWHSTNFGKTIVPIAGGVSQAWAIASGAPAIHGGPASVFIAGVVNGVYGIFRSDNDIGKWTRKCIQPNVRHICSNSL